MIKEQLKKLAREFLQAELWEDLTDADVFGVDLEDGRIAYCCVMGNSGIHEGLGIYVGMRGFRSYLDTVNKEQSEDRKVLFDRMTTFEAMQVSFDDNGNPQWWSHHPNMVPSPENSTEEEMFRADLSLLQGLRKAGILQCRLIHPPTPVNENGEEPGFYPVWLLTVNKGDGRIVQTEIVHKADEQGVYNILANLCAAMYQQGHQPLQISVPNEMTENLLKAFCQRQGIKLVKERLPLRELNQAWEATFSYFDRDKNADVMLN